MKVQLKYSVNTLMNVDASYKYKDVSLNSSQHDMMDMTKLGLYTAHIEQP